MFAIQNDNPDVTVQMYTDARAFFGQGGPHRMVMTLPPLIYQVRRVRMRGCGSRIAFTQIDQVLPYLSRLLQ